MNSKLFNLLLETKYPDMDKEALTTVLNATGNQEVALEILLGIYEEPVFKKTIAPTDRKANQSFISYDPFSDKVHSQYNEITRKYGWFNKETDEKVSDTYWEDDAAKKLGIPQERFKIEHDRRIISETISERWSSTTCNASDWK